MKYIIKTELTIVSLLLDITTWVGQIINNGDAHAEVGSDPYQRYQVGVKIGSFGLVIYAVVAGITASILPYIIRRFKNKRTLAAGQVILCLCFATTFCIPAGHTYIAAGLIGVGIADIVLLCRSMEE